MAESRPEIGSRTQPEGMATAAASTLSYAATDSTGGQSGSSPRTVPDVPGYEVLSELGRGGMGVVYLARQVTLKRLVALKMIRQALATEAERVRFQAEAEAVARLQHPNIVQVFEVGECAAGPFVALEYVGGGSLDRQLKQASLEARAAAVLTGQLAHAVHAAHEKGIIHRDLKPANVLLAEASGTLAPKVSDFGLAKFLDDLGPELTHEGAVLGTPSYMAPEQASGRTREVGPAADIYALGAILYECLTGRPPFKGATSRETLDLVCRNDPVSVRQLRPGVPRDLDTICLKCLRKEEGKRYASAADLAADLERFLDGRPIAARPVGRLEKTVKWAKRRPSAAALVAVLVVTGLVAAVVAVLVYQQLELDRVDALNKQALAEAGERKATEQENIAKRATEDLRVSTEKERQALGYALLQNKTALANRNVGDAFRALRDFRSDEGEYFLNAVDEDVRGWEWRFLRGYLQRSPLLVPAACTCVTFHPSGGSFAAGSATGEVRIFGFNDLTRPTAWSWHKKKLQKLAYDPHGKYLAASSDGGLLVVADASTGKELFRRQCQPTDTRFLSFTPDGKLLACGAGEGRVRFLELPVGKERDPFQVHRLYLTEVAYLKDGRWAVSSSMDGEVKVWETETGKPAAKLDDAGLFGFAGCCATDPGRGRLAAADMTGRLAAWDAATGKVIWKDRLPTAGWVNQFAYSPDGARLFGKTQGGAIHVWEAASGRVLMTLLEKESFFTDDLAVSRDGKHLAVAGRKGVKLWHLALPLEAFAHTEKGEYILKEVTFTADSRELCARIGDGRFVRVDAATGKETFRRATDGQNLFPWALAPGGQGYAGGGKDGVVRFLDARTGAVRVAAAERTGPLTCLAFSPDGRRLAAGVGTGGVVVLDAADGRVRNHFEAGKRGASGVAIDDGDRYLAAGLWTRGVVVWDLAENRKVWERAAGDGRSTVPVFRPGGKQLALACADSVIRVFTVATGEVVFELRGHTNSVTAAGYSPDGKRLATYGDRTVRLWDAETGQMMLTIPVIHPFTDHVTFSPDSRRLAVTESLTVRVYDAPP